MDNGHVHKQWIMDIFRNGVRMSLKKMQEESSGLRKFVTKLEKGRKKRSHGWARQPQQDVKN